MFRKLVCLSLSATSPLFNVCARLGANPCQGHRDTERNDNQLNDIQYNNENALQAVYHNADCCN